MSRSVKRGGWCWFCGRAVASGLRARVPFGWPVPVHRSCLSNAAAKSDEWASATVIPGQPRSRRR